MLKTLPQKRSSLVSQNNSDRRLRGASTHVVLSKSTKTLGSFSPQKRRRRNGHLLLHLSL